MERQYKTPELIKTDSSIFEDAYEGSYYTIIGAGDDPMDWVNFVSDVLYKSEIGIPEVFYMFKGKDMDEYYELTGNNRYQDNLTFLAFPLDGLNVNKLAMLKLRMEDHWFDDIVDDNARRESRYNHRDYMID